MRAAGGKSGARSGGSVLVRLFVRSTGKIRDWFATRTKSYLTLSDSFDPIASTRFEPGWELLASQAATWPLRILCFILYTPGLTRTRATRNHLNFERISIYLIVCAIRFRRCNSSTKLREFCHARVAPGDFKVRRNVRPKINDVFGAASITGLGQ